MIDPSDEALAVALEHLRWCYAARASIPDQLAAMGYTRPIDGFDDLTAVFARQWMMIANAGERETIG
jgi:hypothetical protein